MVQKLFKLSKDEEERALALFKKSITFDAQCQHCQVYSSSILKRMNELIKEGMPSGRIMDELEKMRDINPDKEARDMYAAAWKATGITGQSPTVSSKLPGEIGQPTWAGSVHAIQKWMVRFQTYKDVIVQATTAEDIRKAKTEGKVANMFKFQNTTPISEDLNNLDFFYGFGVRIIQLTYNLRNFVGDGCTERQDSGLSDFGIRLVERMNKLGMLVDTGHCGMKTSIDAAEVSKVPMCATHSFAREIAFKKHPRGKTDEALKAIAESGGVIGVVAVPMFLKERDAHINDFLDHIDYIVKLVGVDHVGIGTDWGYGVFPREYGIGEHPDSLVEIMDREIITPESGSGFKPEHRVDRKAVMVGFENCTKWSNFVLGLVSRGYSDQEIQKIIGLNWLNLIERVIG